IRKQKRDCLERSIRRRQTYRESPSREQFEQLRRIHESPSPKEVAREISPTAHLPGLASERISRALHLRHVSLKQNLKKRAPSSRKNHDHLDSERRTPHSDGDRRGDRGSRQVFV